MSNRQALRLSLKKKFKLFQKEFSQFKNLPFSKFIELERTGAISEMFSSKKKSQEVVVSTTDTSDIDDLFVSDVEIMDE